MSVVYVESSLTVHVLLANILATIAPCVSCYLEFWLGLLKIKNECSGWQMRTLLSYGMNLVAR